MIHLVSTFVRLMLVVGILCLLTMCNESHRDTNINRNYRDLSKQLDTLETRANGLSAQWNDVVTKYDQAEDTYRQAQKEFKLAERLNSRAGEAFTEAKHNFDSAKTRWEFYQILVAIAAQIDARNLDSYRRFGIHRAEGFSCQSVSTAQFRRYLIKGGVNLVGKDIDHIIPRSLGGADHPSNYQVLDGSLNRSLGAEWSKNKCMITGRKCAEAVAVSRACGSFKGSAF